MHTIGRVLGPAPAQKKKNTVDADPDSDDTAATAALPLLLTHFARANHPTLLPYYFPSPTQRLAPVPQTPVDAPHQCVRNDPVIVAPTRTHALM